MIQASLRVRGLTSRAPPLVGDGVGEQANAGFVADARAEDAGELGRPDGGQGVVGHFDDVEAAGLGHAEAVGEEVVLAWLRSGRAGCAEPGGRSVR